MVLGLPALLLRAVCWCGGEGLQADHTVQLRLGGRRAEELLEGVFHSLGVLLRAGLQELLCVRLVRQAHIQRVSPQTPDAPHSLTACAAIVQPRARLHSLCRGLEGRTFIFSKAVCSPEGRSPGAIRAAAQR